MSVGQCMEGGSLSFPPPPPPGLHPWDAFVEGIKITLDHELLCQVTDLLEETLKQGDTTESSSDPARPSVVELGIGHNITNLVQLARHYPTATIYGFDTAINSSDERLLQRQLDESGYADRIVIMPENYLSYDGNLLNNTDIVVSVAPYTKGHIDQAIERFIKPGGVVDVILAPVDTLGKGSELLQTLQDTYKKKPGALFKTASVVSEDGINGGTIHSSLGIPFSSHHFQIGVRTVELYIPSW